MSTIDRIQGLQGNAQLLPNGRGLRIAIAVADWNSNITHPLLDGARERLLACGVHEEDIRVVHVPGAYELTNAAARLKRLGLYHAIIVVGCVVRGDTPHFDYVCQGVTTGTSLLNADMANPTPVIFCVLTTDTMAQAAERAGGALGNKGEEAAEAALCMADLAPGVAPLSMRSYVHS